MPAERMVFWSVKKLAKEFNMPRTTVGRLLNAIGAKLWTPGSGRGRIYYWSESD